MRREWPAKVTIFLVASAWGSTFALIKDVLHAIAPEPFIALRFTIAGIVLVAIASARRQLDRALVAPGVTLGALVFVGYWMQTHGLLFISPSRSALLTGLYVVMVPFADRLLRRRRVSAPAWIASGLAVIGTAELIGGFAERPSAGDLLTLGCAVCFALHVVYTADFTTSHSSLGLAAVQVLLVGLVAIPPSLFVPRPQPTRQVVVVILFTAVVTTALAFVALMWGQARVSATEAAVILSAEPLAAAAVSVLVYGEPLTRGAIFGGTAIVSAMIISQLRSG